MDYALIIEERKSTRAFKNKSVPAKIGDAVKEYHDKSCMRLLSGIETDCIIVGTDAQEALEGAAGYKDYLEGAPSFMILLSEPHEKALINAGYITEDISLMLADQGIGSCFVTFTDSDVIKSALNISSEKQVAAILAFGYAERVKKKIHFNVITMSKVSSRAKQEYYSPKKGVFDLVYLDSFGNKEGVSEKLDFFGDPVWEPLLAASNSPSYMNRQPYAFVLKGNEIALVMLPDEYTGKIDAELNMGVVMQHFIAVARHCRGDAAWDLEAVDVQGLPDDAVVVGTYNI